MGDSGGSGVRLLQFLDRLPRVAGCGFMTSLLSTRTGSEEIGCDTFMKTSFANHLLGQRWRGHSRGEGGGGGVWGVGVGNPKEKEERGRKRGWSR